MGAWSQDRKGEDEGKLWVGGVRGGVRAGKEKMRENCGWVELGEEPGLESGKLACENTSIP